MSANPRAAFAAAGVPLRNGETAIGSCLAPRPPNVERTWADTGPAAAQDSAKDITAPQRACLRILLK